MKLGRYFQGFAEQDQENAFRDEYAVGNVATTRNIMVLGAGFFYGFFLWDKIIDPAQADTTHAIRAAISIFVSIIAVFASVQNSARLVEPLITTATTIAAASLCYIFFVLEGGFEYGAAGLIIVMLYTYSLVPVRLAYLVFFSIISLASFALLQFLRPPSVGISSINLLYITSAIILGIIGAVRRENNARRTFLLNLDLQYSQQRVRDLLNSILPEDIVARIESGEKSIADAHSEVCIVFIDLVGFTELSRRLGPLHLVELLDELFTSFDAVAEEYSLERIKTIGDAYMAVAGLKEQRESSAAHDAANFAFAVQAHVRTIGERRQVPISARVGMHVGPVVAGVIGRKKPAFDCWGEAVNLASRLESAASPGQILVSESTYWRLKDSFDVYAVDDRLLKGVGPTSIYLLTGPQSASHA